MIRKPKEQEKAIALRKEGKSLREILVYVPVAKSTLSLWLRDVGLSKRQKQRLTEKRIQAQKKGAASRRTQRVASTQTIHTAAERDISLLSDRELWLMGIMLYWAEGTKQKPHSVSQPVHFSNSDPRMLQLFLNWLTRCCKIFPETIGFEIYVHETHRHRILGVRKYWARALKLPLQQLSTVYFKKGNPKTLRKNVGENYFGLIRIKVPASTNFNRKIEGWVNGICKYWGIV